MRLLDVGRPSTYPYSIQAVQESRQRDLSHNMPRSRRYERVLERYGPSASYRLCMSQLMLQNLVRVST